MNGASPVHSGKEGYPGGQEEGNEEEGRQEEDGKRTA